MKAKRKRTSSRSTSTKKPRLESVLSSLSRESLELLPLSTFFKGLKEDGTSRSKHASISRKPKRSRSSLFTDRTTIGSALTSAAQGQSHKARRRASSKNDGTSSFQGSSKKGSTYIPDPARERKPTRCDSLCHRHLCFCALFEDHTSKHFAMCGCQWEDR